MRKKKTTKQFKQEVYDLVGDEYTVLGEYTNCDTKVEMMHNCKENPHKCFITPYNFLKGRRCNECSGRKKKTTKQFKQEVYNLVGDEYTVLGEYENNKKSIEIRHNCEKCHNHIFKPSPNSFLRGSRCPICSGKYCKDTKWFKQEIYDLVGDEYTVLGEYKSKKDPIKMRHNCDKCNNHIYYPSPNNFLTGKSRCDKCSKGKRDSIMEYELREYIESLVKCYSKKYSERILNGKDIDILTKGNIGFEFNGLRWHSETKLKEKNVDPINYHLNKTLEASNRQINLIHIFEDEWLYKQNIIKHLIKGILKYEINDSTKNFTIRKVNKNEKTEFLNNNNLKGNIKSTINIGLYNNFNDLVSIMCFNVLDNEKYELVRFSNKLNFYSKDSYSLLLNYFKNNYKWNKIICKISRRWNFEEIYKEMGWKIIGYTNPDYYYTYSNKRYNKNIKINNPLKYDKIWDCGEIILEIDVDDYIE